MIADYISITPLQVELVPDDCRGRWRGIVGLCSGLASIPAPIIGGLIWENLGGTYLILTPILIDLLLRIPMLTTIPEKINTNHRR